MLSPLHHSNSLALYINLYCRNVSTTSATLDNMMTSSRISSIPCFYFNGVFVPGVKAKNVNFKMSPSTD